MCSLQEQQENKQIVKTSDDSFLTAAVSIELMGSKTCCVMQEKSDVYCEKNNIDQKNFRRGPILVYTVENRRRFATTLWIIAGWLLYPLHHNSYCDKYSINGTAFVVSYLELKNIVKNDTNQSSRYPQ